MTVDLSADDGPWLRVGEVARRTGLTVRTLHHYDEIGLLIPSGRSAGDYRLYGPDDLRRLLQIEHLKSLGLRLDDVAAALDDPAFDARGVLEEHIAAVTERIAAERELLARLRGLRDASGAGWAEVLDVIALTERLRHPDSSVRVRAALDAPAATPVGTLVDALVSEQDPAVLETLTWAIARQGTAATPLLLRHLHDRRDGVRFRAAHVLSKLRDRSASAALAGLLNDQDAAVAAKAAFALGQLGGSAALAALLGRLGSGPEQVRDAVGHAIGAFGPAAVPGLRAALTDCTTEVRQSAADVLGLVAEPSSTDALVTALGDADAGVRFAALVALGELPAHAADDAIAGAAHSDDARVRALAKRLLSDSAGA